MAGNVAGAAIATVLGNVFQQYFTLCILSLKIYVIYSIKRLFCKKKILIGVFSIGIPASLNSILMSTSNIVINKFMMQHGDMAVAGLGVAMKVNMIAVMLLIGVGTGIQPLLGYCFGSRK